MRSLTGVAAAEAAKVAAPSGFRAHDEGVSTSPSHVAGCVVDAPSPVCFDPGMETAGTAHTVLLDPFWVSRRADQFDQVCC